MIIIFIVKFLFSFCLSYSWLIRKFGFHDKHNIVVLVAPLNTPSRYAEYSYSSIATFQKLGIIWEVVEKVAFSGPFPINFVLESTQHKMSSKLWTDREIDKLLKMIQNGICMIKKDLYDLLFCVKYIRTNWIYFCTTSDIEYQSIVSRVLDV